MLTRTVEERSLIPPDADRLVQVLSNLLSNAIKYSPDGGEVTVSSWKGMGRWRLALGITAKAFPPISSTVSLKGSSATKTT